MRVSFHIESHLDNVDGSVYLFLENGKTLYLEKPWARDASGADVSTHCEVDGDYLRQIIESPEDVRYPPVADPAWSYTMDYGVPLQLREWRRRFFTDASTAISPYPGRQEIFPLQEGTYP